MQQVIKGSIQNLNNNYDKGWGYGFTLFKTLRISEKSMSISITIIEYHTLEILLQISPHHSSLKLNLFKTLLRNDHDILSYVLVISNLRTTLPQIFFVLEILWTISCVSITLFVIDLPETNPLLLLEIRPCNKGLGLLARFLEIILLINLLRLIGLRSTKLVGESILGIKARHV